MKHIIKNQTVRIRFFRKWNLKKISISNKQTIGKLIFCSRTKLHSTQSMLLIVSSSQWMDPVPPSIKTQASFSSKFSDQDFPNFFHTEVWPLQPIFLLLTPSVNSLAREYLSLVVHSACPKLPHRVNFRVWFKNRPVGLNSCHTTFSKCCSKSHRK